MARQLSFSDIKNSFFRRGSVLRNTFLTILSLLLAVMVVFQLMLYRNTYQNLKTSVSDSHSSFLSLASALSDENFSNLCDAAYQLAWNSTVLNVSLFPDYQNRPRNFEVVSILKSFVAGTEYVKEAVVLCRYDQSIYASSGTVCALDDYNNVQDLSAVTLTPVGSPDFYLVQTDRGQICLRYPFIPCSHGYLGEVLLYLDTDALFSSLCSDESPLSVYTGNGQLLFTNTQPPVPVSSASDTVMAYPSSVMDLVFCHSYLPAVLSIGEYLSSGNMALLLIVVFCLLLALSLLVAWAFYRPLHETLQTLRQPSGSGGDATSGDWAVLNRSIQNLNENSQRYQNIIGIISPYIQQQLLQDLVDGAALDADAVRQTLSGIQNGLPCQAQFLLFATVNTITGVLNPAAIEPAIRNLQNLHISGYRLYSFPCHYTILTLACTEEERPLHRQDIENLAHTIAVFTHNLSNSAVLSSAPFHDLLQIREVYLSLISRSVSDAARQLGTDVDLEQLIRQTVHTITERPEEAAITTVNHLITTIRQAELSDGEQLRSCHTLAQTMYELARSYHVKVGAPVLDAELFGSDAFYADLTAYLHMIAHELFINLDNRQRKYLLAAQEYMAANYQNSDLSLTAVAAQLGISPSYLSRIFTEAYGTRFTQQLNDLRIEKAIQLLSDENRLIRDIGSEVGFLTIQNFMRVFKKKTGVTPSEYRSALLHKGLPS